MRVDDRSGVVAVVVTVVTLVLCFGTVAWVALSEHDDLPRADAGVSRSASRDVSRSATEPAALRVYRAWQRRREAAWALGDPRSLRALYVDPRAARADVGLLRTWLGRGMSGVVMSHQLLAYEVQVDRDDRVRLRVTQRLAWAVATSNGAARKLPHDGAQVQEVVLRKVGEEWLVVRVRSVPPEEPVSQLR